MCEEEIVEDLRMIATAHDYSCREDENIVSLVSVGNLRTRMCESWQASLDFS